MMYPYLSRISYRLKKSGEINATKQSWVNRYLIHVVKKNEIYPHFTKNDLFQEITANVAVEKNIQRSCTF